MARGTPKYSLIADQLLRDIRNGRYKKGDSLPTESELMLAYNVSRHTVRAAVQDLRIRGIVTSRQGQGSRVVSDGQTSALVENIDSVDELIAVGQETRRKLLSSSVIKADSDLAESFSAPPGRHLLRVFMLRYLRRDRDHPVAYLTLWMDALFESAINDFEQPGSVAKILENHFGNVIGSVTQSVTACAMDKKTARLLKQDEGAPGLVTDRCYAVSIDAPPYLRVRAVYTAASVRVVSHFQSTALR